MKVNRKELSNLLSVSYQTIPNYEGEGLPVLTGNVKSGKQQEYDLKECITWYIERNKKGKKGSEAAALRKLEAEADISEIKRDKELNKLIPIETVIKFIGGDYAMLRSKLLLMPDQMSQELYILSNAREIKNALDKEIRSMLNGMANDTEWNSKLLEEVTAD